MATLHANGIDLFYTVQGRGEPLLLIGGFACDHTYWSLLMPSLVSHYQVIRFDNCGVGQSSAPDRPYTISQMADDAAALLKHLNLDRVHVAGHSMGGQIAQELTLAHPELVQSLLLLSSWAKPAARLKMVIESLGDLPAIVTPDRYTKIILPWAYSDRFFATPGAIDQILKLAASAPHPPTAHGLYHQSRAIIASDTHDRLGKIHCPTLVLVSNDDIMTPIPDAEALAQGIPNAELIVLPIGSHGIVVEVPEAVVTAMLDFLAKHTPLTSAR